jgi:hypothetical protein
MAAQPKRVKVMLYNKAEQQLVLLEVDAASLFSLAALQRATH